MTDLQVELFCDQASFRSADEVALRSRFTNTGDAQVLLTFWWNRRIELRDGKGEVVSPGPGPTLPCGMAERPTTLQPGQAHDSREGLACTQPAGATVEIGWQYSQLEPGEYRARLVFAYPPSHGYDTEVEGHWEGSITSNEVMFTILERRKGFFARLFGG